MITLSAESHGDSSFKGWEQSHPEKYIKNYKDDDDADAADDDDDDNNNNNTTRVFDPEMNSSTTFSIIAHFRYPAKIVISPQSVSVSQEFSIIEITSSSKRRLLRTGMLFQCPH